ncbi:putative Hexaprenyldihydroxybenzoate methyltransferase [Heracleum sosnowskyi]|uniref:Hexaprenyldihydroxybenzoate methyltransferase n=1 Tax=Heracleum sosnowskyi TaxID=360622 RepID=A0AAD8HIE3_9APIA|nr:putative Hexaprenyldihydroxybenzoate methyltransferase [Heracleum sosnowskyi]
MALKLLTRIRTVYRTRVLTGPTQICPSQTRRLIQRRPYSVDHNNIRSTSTPVSSSISSLNQTELIKFSAVADSWWDADGPFRPLHIINPTRLAFIRSTLCRHFGKDPNTARPFEGLKFVDVGCGGGILSEPLARMVATMTGVDAVDKNITIARLHAVYFLPIQIMNRFLFVLLCCLAHLVTTAVEDEAEVVDEAGRGGRCLN